MMSLIKSSTLYPQQGLTKRQLEARELAINDLKAFIALVAPFQTMGNCHRDLCDWISQQEGNNKLILWPRDHCKSRYASFYSAWRVVRDPAVTIIYGSATAEKAEEMLRFVKTILESPRTQRYFPGLIHPVENKRNAWNNNCIIIDHPERLKRGVVDATINTCGIGKTITGKHCDLVVLDDVVVNNNNSEAGRKELNRWFDDISSIMSTDSEMLVVGTRYHPKDLYQRMMDTKIEGITDEDGNPLEDDTDWFVVNQKQVEAEGEFLWPRQLAETGKYYGFNQAVLNKKRAGYTNLVDFYSQYYNSPNSSSETPIGRDLFQYYNKDELECEGNTWLHRGEPLGLYAAIDLAFSESDDADYTAMGVGGIKENNDKLLLDIQRFKTRKSSVILERIVALYAKFRFKHLRIEAVAGQRMIAENIADQLKERGIKIPIEFYVPPSTEGGKAVRILNTLEPAYRTSQIWHYRGGNSQILEDELLMENPQNDDMKDVWFMIIDSMKPMIFRQNKQKSRVVQFNSKFGGLR